MEVTTHKSQDSQFTSHLYFTVRSGRTASASACACLGRFFVRRASSRAPHCSGHPLRDRRLPPEAATPPTMHVLHTVKPPTWPSSMCHHAYAFMRINHTTRPPACAAVRSRAAMRPRRPHAQHHAARGAVSRCNHWRALVDSSAAPGCEPTPLAS